MICVCYYFSIILHAFIVPYMYLILFVFDYPCSFCGCVFFFFFFKQKTAYEMRISDWSSDVCSSDLGAPRVAWRTTYDRGVKHKPGQLSPGSRTTPTFVDERLVAITDNAYDQMFVVFHDRQSGKVVCKAPVFESGRSATENSLVTVDGGVIVENNYGYTGPQRVMLGRASEPGIARVNVNGDECEVAWTNEVVAPTSVPKVSLETGLLYDYAKRHNLWGVQAWYFTGINVRTGKTVFSVRTGLGTLFNNHYAAVTIAPDGSAFIATLAGLVRVRDRQ